MAEEDDMCVKVAVRCRPLFKFEIARGEKIGKPVSTILLGLGHWIVPLPFFRIGDKRVPKSGEKRCAAESGRGRP